MGISGEFISAADNSMGLSPEYVSYMISRVNNSPYRSLGMMKFQQDC
jgi:hypothetical protein